MNRQTRRESGGGKAKDLYNQIGWSDVVHVYWYTAVRHKYLWTFLYLCAGCCGLYNIDLASRRVLLNFSRFSLRIFYCAIDVDLWMPFDRVRVRSKYDARDCLNCILRDFGIFLLDFGPASLSMPPAKCERTKWHFARSQAASYDCTLNFYCTP